MIFNVDNFIELIQSRQIVDVPLPLFLLFFFHTKFDQFLQNFEFINSYNERRH